MVQSGGRQNVDAASSAALCENGKMEETLRPSHLGIEITTIN